MNGLFQDICVHSGHFSFVAAILSYVLFLMFQSWPILDMVFSRPSSIQNTSERFLANYLG